MSKLQILEDDAGFGIYLLVVAKGFTRIAKTPVYLLDNVPGSNGGWGYYLPHGVNIEGYDRRLFATLQTLPSDQWQATPSLSKFVEEQLDRIFPGAKKQFSFLGSPYSRFQYSRGRKENRLYWMIPISVSFFDVGDTSYKARHFNNTWRWFSIKELQKDSHLCSVAGYILDPIVDVTSGVERRPITRNVLGIRDALGDFASLASARWVALLALIVGTLTAINLVATVEQTAMKTNQYFSERAMQTQLMQSMNTRDGSAWAKRILATEIRRNNANYLFRDGCLLKSTGLKIQPGIAVALERKLNAISIIFGPFSCK